MVNPKDNPNASVAMIAGAIVSNVVWILAYYHVAVPAGISAGWVTLVVGALLYLGKKKRPSRPAAKRSRRKPLAADAGGA